MLNHGSPPGAAERGLRARMIGLARKGIAEAQSREVFDAYVATLKSKAKVEINQANLDKK